jgi:hypothetical protein
MALATLLSGYTPGMGLRLLEYKEVEDHVLNKSSLEKKPPAPDYELY